MFEHNGKIYARVSDIIKPFVDFSGIPEALLNRKATLGTHIHDAIHDEIQGNFAVVLADEQGYMQSFEKWRDAIAPEFMESEVRYYCDKKRITGCIDGLIKLQGEEKTVLIDWKTSAQESPITWPMQGHLYHYLLTNAGKPIAARMLFIKLNRDGDLPRVFEYKFDDNIMARCFEAIDTFWTKNVAINQM